MEPKIQIGGHVLSEAQAIAVRVAITNFHSDTQPRENTSDLGPIGDAYHARLTEVLQIMLYEARR